MYRRIALLCLVLAVCFIWVPAFCQQAEPVKEASKEVPQEQVLAIATEAVKAQGVKLDAVDIIYDEGGQLWSERLGVLTGEDKSPNHGILRHGFLKNYRIVYFDFKAPIKDIWVFVDKDTGDVLTVYREE